MLEAATSEPASAVEIEEKPADSDSGGSNDFLSAFRESEEESDVSDLLRNIEDIPMQEILTELREVRELMGITGPVAEDDVAEDDE